MYELLLPEFPQGCWLGIPGVLSPKILKLLSLRNLVQVVPQISPHVDLPFITATYCTMIYLNNNDICVTFLLLLLETTIPTYSYEHVQMY